MCRHLGYLGPARAVADVLTEGSTSLLNQSFAPRDMRGGGTINADGFGACWWDGSAIGRYRSAQPLWSDPAVRETLSSIRSTAVVAAARSATVGMPVERSACAPFVGAEAGEMGAWAFSHNGVVPGWPHSIAPLAATLSVTELLGLEASTDSATLWLLLARALRDDPPETALPALSHAVAEAAPGARLNFLLCNGTDLWATTWYHSLSVLVDDDRAVVASEPLDDDPRWESVADRHLVVARPGRLIVTPLEIGVP
ncbi:ergothioneine biosynthesis protein EgtC [Rhodococcus sp. HNM0569]|uniref:ergothioneine biosynthesis protein EgtC n=1 Tax=Rhodococcus sp. HNM0569 TaxID=2716340 RepID=UPI00146E7EEA|nr:ergothioneine biosynthesis protein EgtC [Rhodococcus sp. HNM0569]NLU82713.1 ergothioneine biosynthesis protein EgtC [Rhodococcus sp. HNM0569]